MKSLKTILVLLLLPVAFNAAAQDIDEKSSVTSMVVEVNDITDLNDINWNDIFSVFDENAPKDPIAVSVKFKDGVLRSNEKVEVNDLSVTVNGLSENKEALQELIAEKAKKMMGVIEKITD